MWAFEQEERKFTEQDVFVPWNLQYKFEDEKVLENITKQDSQSSSSKTEDGDGDQLFLKIKVQIVKMNYKFYFRLDGQ